MKYLTPFLLLLTANAALADVVIENRLLGSGLQNEAGYSQAKEVYPSMLHVPQYMPGYPTAAVIWPRVIDVNCSQDGFNLKCEGYNWLPTYGRGEYLMIRPVRKEEPPVVKCCENVIIHKRIGE